MPAIIGNLPNQVPTNGDLGTLAFQDNNAINVLGGVINNTTIGNVSPSTGSFTSLSANANVIFSSTSSSTSNTTGALVVSGGLGVSGNTFLNNSLAAITTTPAAVNYVQVTGAVTGGSPTISAQGADTDIDLNLNPKGTGTVVANGPFTATGNTSLGGVAGSESLRVLPPTSVVGNYFQVNTSSGGDVIARSTGTGSTIGILYNTKGSGSHRFSTSGNISNEQFRVTDTASAVNFVQVTGAITGNAPIISAQGSDTNISQVFQTKGTGALNLAAGSSGVNISNGTTVTAITRTANGSGYTGVPSVAISAPTTAGGVQATVTCTVGVSTFAVAVGGTGYTVGDVLTIVGGTGIAATFTVATLSGSAVSTVTSTNAGSYSVVPTNPLSTTGGTGTGCTININTYSVTSGGFTITNAGSGYVEQPTVTFSGGGGSGAAAYASVGSSASIKNLGGSLGFSGASGEVFRIYDFGGQSGVGVRGHTLPGIAPAIFPTPSNGSQTNINFQVASLGTGTIQLSTGGGISAGAFNQIDQMRVSHTASAVNFVQVTGAATGGRPRVEVNGSDTNIDLRLNAKGSGGVYVHTFFVAGAQSFNNVLIQGAATGSSPFIAASGGDANIDLNLTPKGTGVVRANGYAVLDQSDVGNAPNQIPLNQYLGNLAFVNNNAVNLLDIQTNTTTSNTSNQVVASWSASSYRTIKIVISATDTIGAKYHSTELLAVSNGTNIAFTEYAAINLGGLCATYSVDISGGNIRLLATPSSSNSTEFKVASTIVNI